MISNFDTLPKDSAKTMIENHVKNNPCLIFIHNYYYKVDKWEDAIKVFYYYLNLDNDNYVDSLAGLKSKNGKLLFSHIEHSESFIKVSNTTYVKKLNNWYSNYALMMRYYKIVYNKDNSKCQLFLSTKDLNDEEVLNLINDHNDSISTKKPKIRKIKYFINKINREIYTPKEKFILKYEKQFDNKKLLGDVYFNDDDYNLLLEYMSNELNQIIHNNSYIVKHKKIFALGLVQYAIKYYKKSTFWPQFETEYGIKVPTNKQANINAIFEQTMDEYGKEYDKAHTTKIDNICMHGFVSNNYLKKFFNYLFEFWRIDLKRNYENINEVAQQKPRKTYFNILIEELTKVDGNFSADICQHTSLAIKHFYSSCNKRIRKYLRNIDECFWLDKGLLSSKNRVRNALKDWIESSNGMFNKELKIVRSGMGSGKRGKNLFFSPIFNVNYETNELKLFVPTEHFVNYDETKESTWHIYNEDKTFDYTSKAEIIKGKVGYYSEEFFLPISMDYLFDKLTIELYYDNVKYRTFNIKESKNRFFNNDGDLINVNLKDSYIPTGYLSVFSLDGYQPHLLYKDNQDDIVLGNYIISTYDLEKGDILLLHDKQALQAGYRLEEGYIGNYLVNGVNAKINNKEVQVFNKLPKLLFKCSEDIIKGCGLIINNKTYRLNVNLLTEIKLYRSSKEPNAYLINLNDFITENGIYDITLSIPRYSGNSEYKFLYIKDFEYEFIDAPYVFKDYGEIKLSNRLTFDYSKYKDNYEKFEDYSKVTFKLDLSSSNESFKDGKLYLDYMLNGKKINLEFTVPVLYWQYGDYKLDGWRLKKPQDIVLKNLPNKLYVKGPFDFSSKFTKFFVDDSFINDDANSEVFFEKNNDNGFYYAKLSDFYHWLNRDEVYRSLSLNLDGKEFEFLKLICRSIVLDKQIVGDFNHNLLYGFFDIQGESEYYIDIYKNDEKIFEEVQLKDGKFILNYDLTTGLYRIVLSEVEQDEFDFDSNNFEIASYNLQLINLLELNNTTITLNRILDKDCNVGGLVLNDNYIINQLEKVNYNYFTNKDYDINIWQDDYNDNLEDLIYYKGSLCKVDNYGNSKFIMRVVVVFRNNYNIKDVVILKKDDGQYIEIEYDLSRCIIIRDSSKLDRHYKYKNIIPLCDDLYDFAIDIDKNNSGR